MPAGSTDRPLRQVAPRCAGPQFPEHFSQHASIAGIALLIEGALVPGGRRLVGQCCPGPETAWLWARGRGGAESPALLRASGGDGGMQKYRIYRDYYHKSRESHEFRHSSRVGLARTSANCRGRVFVSSALFSSFRRREPRPLPPRFGHSHQPQRRSAPDETCRWETQKPTVGKRLTTTIAVILQARLSDGCRCDGGDGEGPCSASKPVIRSGPQTADAGNDLLVASDSVSFDGQVPFSRYAGSAMVLQVTGGAVLRAKPKTGALTLNRPFPHIIRQSLFSMDIHLYAHRPRSPA